MQGVNRGMLYSAEASLELSARGGPGMDVDGRATKPPRSSVGRSSPRAKIQPSPVAMSNNRGFGGLSHKTLVVDLRGKGERQSG